MAYLAPATTEGTNCSIAGCVHWMKGWNLWLVPIFWSLTPQSPWFQSTAPQIPIINDLTIAITCQVQTPSGKCPPESKSVIPSWINFNKSTFPFTCEKDHSPQLKHLNAGFFVGSIFWFWSYQLIAVVLIFTAVGWIDDNTLKRKINLKSDLKWQQRAHLGILCPWRRRGTEQQAGRSPASPRASCAATPGNCF